jgi:hypothetical protein
MLQCVKKYIRRTLKGNKKKIDDQVMGPGPGSLSLFGHSKQEVKRRVALWLEPPHEQFLHLRGNNVSISMHFLRNTLTFYLQGQIEVPFGRDVVQRCVKAVGYGRGSNLSVGAEWERLGATPADVFGYVGNLVSSLFCRLIAYSHFEQILSSLFDNQTGTRVEVKMDSETFGPAFSRIYNDARLCKTNELLTAIRKQVCQGGGLSL